MIADPRDTVTAVQITRREIIVGSADGFVYRYDVGMGNFISEVLIDFFNWR